MENESESVKILADLRTGTRKRCPVRKRNRKITNRMKKMREGEDYG